MRVQDAALDVQEIVRNAMGERVARTGNRYATAGTGASQPHGLVFAAAAGVTAAAQTAATFDEIIDLEHSVDPLYRADPSARFMFNDATLKALRKIKGRRRPVHLPAPVALKLDRYWFC